MFQSIIIPLKPLRSALSFRFPHQNPVVISYCQGLIAVYHHVTNCAVEVLQVYIQVFKS